jgi:muramoyltetrapeptide carboxypeptidase
LIRPPALLPGSRIALVAPAGPLVPGAVERAKERVRSLGWVPVTGRHVDGRFGYLSGTDAQRLDDLNRALAADDNDAIWCLRGGYGTMRILDRIGWEALRRRPRALIGYSDNTALHLAVQRLGLVSFHGPHPAAELPPFSERSLLRVLTGARAAGVLPFPEGGAAETVVGGRAEGRLVGGNLALLAATLGTRFAADVSGAILFLEDVAEPAYRVDRLLSQLRLAGILHRVAGVAAGLFTECPDDDAALPPLAEVLRDRLSDLGVPVALGFPIGHVPEQWTVPLGVRARLDADRGTLELLEPAVAG